MFNKVQLIGRLAKDNIFKTTQSGIEICKNVLVLNKKGKDGNDKAIYVKIVIIGKVCAIVRSYTQKGDKIGIIGELDYNQWVDKSGVKKFENSVIVEVIELLGNPKSQSNAPQKEQKQTQSAQKNTNVDLDLDLDEIPF